MVTAISSIANAGRFIRLKLPRSFGNDGAVIQSFAPKVQRSGFISANNLQIVQEGMRMAVTQVQLVNWSTLPFSSAGKTGTAQFFG